jgi:hypothetical protein
VPGYSLTKLVTGTVPVPTSTGTLAGKPILYKSCEPLPVPNEPIPVLVGTGSGKFSTEIVALLTFKKSSV